MHKKNIKILWLGLWIYRTDWVSLLPEIPEEYLGTLTICQGQWSLSMGDALEFKINILSLQI